MADGADNGQDKTVSITEAVGNAFETYHDQLYKSVEKIGSYVSAAADNVRAWNTSWNLPDPEKLLSSLYGTGTAAGASMNKYDLSGEVMDLPPAAFAGGTLYGLGSGDGIKTSGVADDIGKVHKRAYNENDYVAIKSPQTGDVKLVKEKDLIPQSSDVARDAFDQGKSVSAALDLSMNLVDDKGVAKKDSGDDKGNDKAERVESAAQKLADSLGTGNYYDACKTVPGAENEISKGEQAEFAKLLEEKGYEVKFYNGDGSGAVGYMVINQKGSTEGLRFENRKSEATGDEPAKHTQKIDAVYQDSVLGARFWRRYPEPEQHKSLALLGRLETEFSK